MDHRKSVFRLNLTKISNMSMFNNPHIIKVIYIKPDIKILNVDSNNLLKLYKNRKIKTLHYDDPIHSQR